MPDRLELATLEGETAQKLHRCANAELVGCNRLVDHEGRLCRSCELTRTRPGDADVI